MSKADQKRVPRGGLTRRAVLAGVGGAAGLAAGLQASSSRAETTMALDLDDPEDNLKALIKLQADLSGKDVIGGFPGTVWSWVPGVGNTLLFKSYGIGASHVEQVDDGWRFYHRELLYYMDPVSGEVLAEWDNPFTGQRVEVMHILNDPVNRFYTTKGGPFTFPRPYEIYGDDLVFRVSFFKFQESLMPRADYPVHSAHDMYQSAELWGISGRLSEVLDPAVTSASCVTSWGRMSQWLPFMEMGDRPGSMVFHSHAYKLLGGAAELPADILAYTEKHHPKYLESPKTWVGLSDNRSQYSETKKEIDRRTDGSVPAGSVFEV